MLFIYYHLMKRKKLFGQPNRIVNRIILHGNKISSCDVSFSRRTSCKICQAYLNLIDYQTRYEKAISNSLSYMRKIGEEFAVEFFCFQLRPPPPPKKRNIVQTCSMKKMYKLSNLFFSKTKLATKKLLFYLSRLFLCVK